MLTQSHLQIQRKAHRNPRWLLWRNWQASETRLEIQGTQNRKTNPAGEQSWRAHSSRFQNSWQSCNHQDGTVLRTDVNSMEQSRESRNKPTRRCFVDFWWRRQENVNDKTLAKKKKKDTGLKVRYVVFWNKQLHRRPCTEDPEKNSVGRAGGARRDREASNRENEVAAPKQPRWRLGRVIWGDMSMT